MSEEEAIINSYPGTVVSVEKLGSLYVLTAKRCDSYSVNLFKENLRKMGFKGLAKRVVVRCLKGSPKDALGEGP